MIKKNKVNLNLIEKNSLNKNNKNQKQDLLKLKRNVKNQLKEVR